MAMPPPVRTVHHCVRHQWSAGYPGGVGVLFREVVCVVSSMGNTSAAVTPLGVGMAQQSLLEIARILG